MYKRSTMPLSGPTMTWPRGNMRYNISCSLITDLGDNEAALDLLGPYVARIGPEGLDWVKHDPDLDAIRNHARFQEMIRQAETRLGIG